MQNNVSMITSEKDLDIKYGMCDPCPEREAARGSVKYILADMNDIRKSFIRLGFHLAEMLRYEYYKDFGFPNIEEFAEANLGMDKSNVYRYIRVYENFAAISDSCCSGALISTPPKMFLSDRWKDFSFSQLVEMCNMSPSQRVLCRPDMTIKQLREIKKTVKGFTNAVEARDIVQRISKGVTAADLKEELKVATSPRKDRSKEFSFDYCFGLHGAARSSYVKSRKSVGEVSVFIYDSEGKLIELDPPIFNSMLELLYCEDRKYVFRLKEVYSTDQVEEGD